MLVKRARSLKLMFDW